MHDSATGKSNQENLDELRRALEAYVAEEGGEIQFMADKSVQTHLTGKICWECNQPRLVVDINVQAAPLIVGVAVAQAECEACGWKMARTLTYDGFGGNP